MANQMSNQLQAGNNVLNTDLIEFARDNTVHQYRRNLVRLQIIECSAVPSSRWGENDPVNAALMKRLNYFEFLVWVVMRVR